MKLLLGMPGHSRKGLIIFEKSCHVSVSDIFATLHDILVGNCLCGPGCVLFNSQASPVTVPAPENAAMRARPPVNDGNMLAKLLPF